MKLSDALAKARSYQELNEIFERRVTVSLSCFSDVVSVVGFDGAVSSDVIARKVALVWSHSGHNENGRELAGCLARAVFRPLRDLVESPSNQCSVYCLVALSRITWTPPQAPEFGHSVALKHATVLGLLDEMYMMG